MHRKGAPDSMQVWLRAGQGARMLLGEPFNCVHTAAAPPDTVAAAAPPDTVAVAAPSDTVAGAAAAAAAGSGRSGRARCVP